MAKLFTWVYKTVTRELATTMSITNLTQKKNAAHEKINSIIRFLLMALENCDHPSWCLNKTVRKNSSAY